MSLFHSTPVTVQRTYYKPSAIARLKALFSPRRRTAVPISTTGRRSRAAPVRRRPIRKTGGFGLFRRSPRARRTVVPPRRRHGGLFASLKPRRHYGRRTRVAPAPRHYHHRHHHHHGKGRTFATILAALSLRKYRRRGYGGRYGGGAYGPAPVRPRF